MYQVNEDNSIYVTRGDVVYLSVSAENNGEPYTFQAGEVLRIKVYGKKDADSVVLQKDFPITAAAQTVDLFLSEVDTKIGEVISKPRDYWYEVELNPYDNPQTIIGYDEDGAKVFKLFPEGADIPEYVPDPDIIKVIDTELDMASERPVQNQVIARAFANLQAGYQATHDAVKNLYVTPEMYGAIGDGVADDTKAIQNAVANRLCMFGNGKTYMVSEMIVVPDFSVIDLNGSTVVRGFGSKHYGTFKVQNNSEICNGVINGNYARNSYGDTDYINHADVWITGKHNTVHGIKFVDSMGESIKIEDSFNTVHSCEFTTFADHAIYCKELNPGTAIRSAVNIYDNTFDDPTTTREAIKVANGFDGVRIYANHAILPKGWFMTVDNGLQGWSNGYIDVFDNTINTLYGFSVTNVYGDTNVVNIHHNNVKCAGNVFKTPFDSTSSVRNGFSCNKLIFLDNHLDINAEYMFIFDMVDTGDVVIENNILIKSYGSGNPRMIYAYGTFDNFMFNGNTVERAADGDNKFNYPLFFVGNASAALSFGGNVFTVNDNKFLTCCSPIIQDGASNGSMVNCHITFIGNCFLTAGTAGFRVIAPSASGDLNGITKYLTFKNNHSINNATIDTGAYPSAYIVS